MNVGSRRITAGLSPWALQIASIRRKEKAKTGFRWISSKSGTANLYLQEIEDQKRYFLSVGEKLEEIDPSAVYIRISYVKNVVYLYEKPGNDSIFSIALEFNPECIAQWENILNQHAVILDFGSDNINAPLKNRIESQCPVDIETKDFCINDNVFSKLGKNVGHIAGKIAVTIKKPMDDAGQALS